MGKGGGGLFTRFLSSLASLAAAGARFTATAGSSKGSSTTSGSTTSGAAVDLAPRRCGFFAATAAGALPAESQASQ